MPRVPSRTSPSLVTNQRLATTQSGNTAGSHPTFSTGARILRGLNTRSEGREGGNGGGLKNRAPVRQQHVSKPGPSAFWLGCCIDKISVTNSLIWCARRDSNARPSDPESDALSKLSYGRTTGVSEGI
jgi:hypothetical protein